MTDTTSSPSSPAGQFFKARDPLMKSFCTSTISRADTGLRTYEERTASLQALHSNTWKQIIQVQHTRVKNPNWREATTWLFTTSMAKDLNSGQPRTNRVSGQSITRTWDHWIASSDALTTWPCCLLLVCATIFLLFVYENHKS